MMTASEQPDREAVPGEALPDVDPAAYGADAEPLEELTDDLSDAKAKLMRSIVTARVRLRGVDAALAQVEELSLKIPEARGDDD